MLCVKLGPCFLFQFLSEDIAKGVLGIRKVKCQRDDVTICSYKVNTLSEEKRSEDMGGNDDLGCQPLTSEVDGQCIINDVVKFLLLA